ncbi:MAG: GFA family protein [Proteobacteria bacterium]|nr:GFA family protein [Pseudomonadota bacterium]
MTNLTTGGCLCGALRYEANSPPTYAGYCFCNDCRKASGGGFIAFMGYPASALRITGDAVTHTLAQSDGRKSERNFCPRCGGLVYGGIRGETDEHTIYAGTLDDPAHFKPAIAIFNSQRPAWVPLPEGLKVFERMPG